MSLFQFYPCSASGKMYMATHASSALSTKRKRDAASNVDQATPPSTITSPARPIDCLRGDQPPQSKKAKTVPSDNTTPVKPLTSEVLASLLSSLKRKRGSDSDLVDNAGQNSSHNLPGLTTTTSSDETQPVSKKAKTVSFETPTPTISPALEPATSPAPTLKRKRASASELIDDEEQPSTTSPTGLTSCLRGKGHPKSKKARTVSFDPATPEPRERKPKPRKQREPSESNIHLPALPPMTASQRLALLESDADPREIHTHTLHSMTNAYNLFPTSAALQEADDDEPSAHLATPPPSPSSLFPPFPSFPSIASPYTNAPSMPHLFPRTIVFAQEALYRREDAHNDAEKNWNLLLELPFASCEFASREDEDRPWHLVRGREAEQQGKRAFRHSLFMGAWEARVAAKVARERAEAERIAREEREAAEKAAREDAEEAERVMQSIIDMYPPNDSDDEEIEYEPGHEHDSDDEEVEDEDEQEHDEADDDDDEDEDEDEDEDDSSPPSEVCKCAEPQLVPRAPMHQGLGPLSADHAFLCLDCGLVNRS